MDAHGKFLKASQDGAKNPVAGIIRTVQAVQQVRTANGNQIIMEAGARKKDAGR